MGLLNRYEVDHAKLAFPLFLILLGIVGGILAFPVSYISSSNVLIGLCLFPFAFFKEGPARFNFLYFIGLVFFSALTYRYHHKIFYFFAISLYVVFIVEFYVGRLNSLMLFLIVVMSPVFSQAAIILGFPIRLYLSEWSGNLLRLAGLDILVDGNMMVLDGFSFTVDEACMGLNMLAISMLMGVFVIAHQYYTTRKRLSLKYLLLFFIIVFVLNVICNLFRIILLVIFKIMPEDPLHELMGVFCLILYVMIPLYFIAKWMISRIAKPLEHTRSADFKSFKHKVCSVVLGVTMLFLGYSIDPLRSAFSTPHAKVSLHGLTSIPMKDGITKMESEELLVYVKPIPEFFTSEHTPLICWKGSGYEFKKVRKEKIAHRELYRGVLMKEKDLLYTAWWYTNGNTHTVDQLNWRSKMLFGEPRFCLVNVTAKDEITLKQHVSSILSDNLLKID